MVNAGNGYELAQPGMLLKLGDRVLTLQGGSTVVAQVDGCVTRLAENTAFTLQQPSVCNGGVNTLRQIGPYYAQAIGAPQPGETATDVPPVILEKTPEAPPPEEVPTAEPEAATEEPISVAGEEPTPDTDKKPKKKKKVALWAAVIAAVLAAGGSSSSSSSSSTPQHP